MDIVDRIIAYENGSPSEEATIELFQTLVNNGIMAWSLQGMYGRQAMRLIDAGLVTRPGVKRITGVLLTCVFALMLAVSAQAQTDWKRIQEPTDVQCKLDYQTLAEILHATPPTAGDLPALSILELGNHMLEMQNCSTLYQDANGLTGYGKMSDGLEEWALFRTACFVRRHPELRKQFELEDAKRTKDFKRTGILQP
jgi:hypothetical protein